MFLFLLISDTFTIHTGTTLNFINLDTYGISGKTQDDITFSVMTCQDAKLALVPTSDFPSLMYDVTIGGWHNSISVIRTELENNANIVDSHYEPNIVSCTEFRDFWVSWTDNNIKCGKGRVVGEELLVDYYDLSQAYEVKFIGISTGWGSSGTWIFQKGNKKLWIINE